jgi:hypothetical protein
METRGGVNTGHARESVAKAGNQRDAHLEDLSMDVELSQLGDEGGNVARTTKSTLDVRPKPDLQWI